MRQWNVDPTKMCRQHLLGEHNEMHSFVGTILKSQKGGKGAIKDFTKTKYVTEGFVEVHNLQKRHEELVTEIHRRGMQHNSPLPEFNSFVCGVINIKANELELGRRCLECDFEDDGQPSMSPRKQQQKEQKLKANAKAQV